MKYLNLFLLPLALSLVGCIGESVPHIHTFYTYTIKYGKDKNNLTQVLTRTCEAYKHGDSLYQFRHCPESLDSIDRYVCAVDGRLYLTDTSSGYRTSSTAISNLDGMYCSISTSSKSEDYIYTDSFMSDSDVKVN